MHLRLLPPSTALGWTPYGWLIYLAYFVAFAVVNNTPRDWVVDGAALVLFLSLYFRGYWVRGTALLTIAFAIVAMGVVLTPRNPGAISFFIYGAAFLAEVGPPAVAARWLLAIVGIIGIEAWVLNARWQFWAIAIVMSLLIGGTNIHFAEVRRKDRALLKAHEAAEHSARIAERERIGRDLHDLLGHTLSVIVLKSELAAKLADRNPARAAEEIRDVERISRNALVEVRGAIHGYRGERLRDELASGREALKAGGVTLVADLPFIALGAEQERALALALREAITNVIRHAGARRCEVSLAQIDSLVTLTIQDDGVGGASPDGSGLAGMRTRLTEVGGTLARDGARGTRLSVVVPSPTPAVSRPAVAS